MVALYRPIASFLALSIEPQAVRVPDFLGIQRETMLVAIFWHGDAPKEAAAARGLD
jgi:hypothetical protein